MNMTTRLQHMKALKAPWEAAPAGRQKEGALKNYEAAQKANATRIDRQAKCYLHAAAAAFK